MPQPTSFWAQETKGPAAFSAEQIELYTPEELLQVVTLKRKSHQTGLQSLSALSAEEKDDPIDKLKEISERHKNLIGADLLNELKNPKVQLDVVLTNIYAKLLQGQKDMVIDYCANKRLLVGAGTLGAAILGALVAGGFCGGACCGIWMASNGTLLLGSGQEAMVILASSAGAILGSSVGAVAYDRLERCIENRNLQLQTETFIKLMKDTRQFQISLLRVLGPKRLELPEQVKILEGRLNKLQVELDALDKLVIGNQAAPEQQQMLDESPRLK